MEKYRVIWWVVGGVAMALMGWVMYLFIIAPLPDHFIENNTSEAVMQLKRVCELQKSYRERHATYAPNLDSIRVHQAENDGGKYWIEIEKADSVNMIARAYARIDFDNDGNQNVWEVGLDCEPKELQAD